MARSILLSQIYPMQGRSEEALHAVDRIRYEPQFAWLDWADARRGDPRCVALLKKFSSPT